MSDASAHLDGQPRLTLAIEVANPGSGCGSGVALGFIHHGEPARTRALAVEPLREVDRDRDDLIPAIERLLTVTGKSRADLQQVAVSIGPGGFTSTRVACATGAMLAEGLGIPVVAVPSALVAVMHQQMQGGGGVKDGHAAVLMASKGEAVWFASVPASLGPVGAAAARNGSMTTAAGIVATGPRLALADAHLPASIRAALETADVPVHPLIFSPEACLRASALCEPGDAATLVPIYPREPEAVTLWRSRHPKVG